MPNTPLEAQCPDELLDDVIHRVQAGDDDCRERVDILLRDYAGDARLHFLQGSLLAGERRYAEGSSAMARAVEIAPDNPVFRFQHGFLELTSGHTESAERIWTPLVALDEDHPMRLFAQGLGHLVRNEFGKTIALLEQGIARNGQVTPLNDDMRLIVEELRKLQAGSGDATANSSVQALLRQYAAHQTKH